MQLSSVRHWFGRQDPALVATDPPRLAHADVAARSAPPAAPGWTVERMSVCDHVWSEGYLLPGAETELLRLALPLDLSGAATVLLVGSGLGGPACSLTAKTGAWIEGYEAEPTLLASGLACIARKRLTRRVRLISWNPDRPMFAPRACHHGLALEPLSGRQPEPVLAAIAEGLKPGAHLALTELTAVRPLDPANPTIAMWAASEGCDPSAVPAERAITRTLRRLGFDVRVAEDISARHLHHVAISWRAATRGIDRGAMPLPLLAAYAGEAMLWTLRERLFKAGWLRMVRWHAVSG